MQRDVVTGGTRISYDDQGRGEPALLLLPDWCASRELFAGLLLGDFGFRELTELALAVIEASEAARVMPVALAHAGWVVLALRRRLLARIPKLVLLSWMVTPPPEPLLTALGGLQQPEEWQRARDHLFGQWLHDADTTELADFVHRVMGRQGFRMWRRAGQAIAGAYAEAGSPLQALAAIQPAVPVLHLYAQPRDDGYLGCQEEFAEAHSWFTVERLPGRTHFPMFETPGALVTSIERFLSSSPDGIPASSLS